LSLNHVAFIEGHDPPTVGQLTQAFFEAARAGREAALGGPLEWVMFVAQSLGRGFGYYQREFDAIDRSLLYFDFINCFRHVLINIDKQHENLPYVRVDYMEKGYLIWGLRLRRVINLDYDWPVWD
jgi:hypothetical protein